MISTEFGELILPLVPELRESVEKKDQRPLARGHAVHSQTTHLNILFFEHRLLLLGLGKSGRQGQGRHQKPRQSSTQESIAHVGSLRLPEWEVNRRTTKGRFWRMGRRFTVACVSTLYWFVGGELSQSYSPYPGHAGLLRGLRG